MIALRLGDQLLLAALSAKSIVFSTLLAVCILKETLVKSDILALFLMCLGSALCLLCAHETKQDYTVAELHNLYSRPASLFVYLFVVITCISCVIVDLCMRSKLEEYLSELRAHDKLDENAESELQENSAINDVLQAHILIKAQFILATVPGVRMRQTTQRLVS